VTRYRDAGVDIPRAERLKTALGPLVRSTWGSPVRDLPRGFAGIMEWPEADPAPRDATAAARARPLLAASMDGVGTKLHLARRAGRVKDAAADLVYHGANDLLVHGARPLAFLDYIAQSRLEDPVILEVITGLASACREVGAALLGGETAEMPDTYVMGAVDVAGCIIGVVESDRVLDGANARAGDRLLGLGSSGLHTNGFSLARRVLADSGLELDQPLPGGSGESLADALLAPHRWYGRALLPLLERGEARALAHITGGGIAGNLERVLPPGVRARVHTGAWPRPAVFAWIMRAGGVPEADARAAFNLGIGMVMICERTRAPVVRAELERAGEIVYEIGVLVDGERGVEWVEG
jgi:phosphoribosylformylglycinamidine cyclo-ligase